MQICAVKLTKFIPATYVTLHYLTLPLGRAGYYTSPVLRPYQFGPMRNPDVTEGHSNWLWSRSWRWSRKLISHLALVTCSMVVLTTWSALSWLLTSRLEIFRSSEHKPHHHVKVADLSGDPLHTFSGIFHEQKCLCGRSSATDPAEGASSAPPDLLAGGEGARCPLPINLTPSRLSGSIFSPSSLSQHLQLPFLAIPVAETKLMSTF